MLTAGLVFLAFAGKSAVASCVVCCGVANDADSLSQKEDYVFDFCNRYQDGESVCDCGCFCDDSGCDCSEEKPDGCFATSALMSRGVDHDSIVGVVLGVDQARKQLRDVQGWKQFEALYSRHKRQLLTLTMRDKRLRNATADYLTKYRQVIASIAKHGNAKLPEASVRDTRVLLERYARVDKGSLARDLRRTVLPRLTDSLSGGDFRAALRCLVGERCP